MNRIKIFIIAGVVLVIIIFFLILSFFNFQGPSVSPREGSPTPTPVLSSSDLFISSILPSDTTQAYLPAQPIQVTFTQKVNKNSLQIQITPPTEVLINPGQSPNSLVISPLTVWPLGTTTISILSTTTSTTGNTLKNPTTYELKTEIPTIPEGEGAY